MIEAYDGRAWYNTWDSDMEGLPVAVRITITSSGHRGPDDVYEAPRAMLRTVVPIDRVLIPKDLLKVPEEEEEETPEDAAEEMLDELPEDIGEFSGGGGVRAPGRGPDSGGGNDAGPRRGPRGGGGRGPGAGSGPPGGGGPTGSGPN
jgi:hypothetical protein